MKIEGIIFDWIGVLSAGSKGGVYPYSKRVLKELKPNYKLGLVSLAGFGNEKRIKDIDESGLRDYFNSIVVDTTKTIEHYLRCIEEMKLTPETTLIVDDRTIKGISIGNRLGCKTCWVMEKKYLHETPNEKTGEPTYRIKSVEELLSVI